MKIQYKYNSAMRPSVFHVEIDLSGGHSRTHHSGQVRIWSVDKGHRRELCPEEGESTAPPVEAPVGSTWSVVTPEHAADLWTALRNLRRIAIPAAQLEEGFCDGASSTLTIESGYSKLTLHWFPNLPAEWVEVDAIMEAIDVVIGATEADA